MKKQINWNSFRDPMVYEGLCMRAEFEGLELLVCRDIHGQDPLNPYAWNISSMESGELFAAGLCSSLEGAIEFAEQQARYESEIGAIPALLEKEA